METQEKNHPKDAEQAVEQFGRANRCRQKWLCIEAVGSSVSRMVEFTSLVSIGLLATVGF